MKRTFAALVLPVFVLLLNCGGGGGDNPPPVTPIAVTSVTLNAAGTSLIVGGTQQLSATISPANATNQSVTWTSDAASVASVSTSGLVTGVATGTAHVTVKTADGGKTASCTVTVTPATAADWTAVDDAVNAVQNQFDGGLTVEVITPAGVVHSVSAGGFSNSTFVAVASASKWVSATTILRLVDQNVFPQGLDTPTRSLLKDQDGNAWTGNLGNATLHHLLSFTTGISGSVPDSQVATVGTLADAVDIIYSEQGPTASAPGSYFYYGSAHLRIAARMAEVATGKDWDQIVKEQLGDPLDWPYQLWNPSLLLTDMNMVMFYGLPVKTYNFDPAGSLWIDGQEYAKFVSLQLRKGLYGSQRLLPEALIDQQRNDGYGTTTTLSYSPYEAALGKTWHYGFGNWLETAGGGAPSATDPVIRWSSTGAFGWAPWVAADSTYAAIIMTRQPGSDPSTNPGSGIGPSEALKVQLDPLIRQALASGTVTVVRSIP